MSQNSTVIPNSNGLTFRTNLNNALDTLGTLKSGPSAPASPSAGWFWFDTINDKLMVRNSANTAWVPYLVADFVGANIQHSIRNSATWLFNEDLAVTGAIQIKINGLYAQTLSGGMIITLSQNNTTDGTYIDHEFYVAGNWRSSDHTWHNTKAIIKSATSLTSVNVRFCSNATDVFIVIGDIGTIWNYPRVVIKDMVSNAVISGYNPDFAISRVVAYPTTTHSTINAQVLDVASSIHGAAAKAILADSDEFGIADSAASWVIKKITGANIKTALSAIYSTIASPTFTGIPTAPTAAAGTNTTQIATTAYVDGKLVLGASVATISGTSIDFIGIPSWAKRITILFRGVSTSGTSAPIVQVGDSGGIEATGYNTVTSSLSAGITTGTFTTGFSLVASTTAAASVMYGVVTLENIDGNSWCAIGSIAIPSVAMTTLTGEKVLSITLDRLRITTLGGTDTFDAGSINIKYEG